MRPPQAGAPGGLTRILVAAGLLALLGTGAFAGAPIEPDFIPRIHAQPPSVLFYYWYYEPHVLPGDRLVPRKGPPTSLLSRRAAADLLRPGAPSGGTFALAVPSL